MPPDARPRPGGAGEPVPEGSRLDSVSRNLGWNLAYQGYAIVLNFGAMLVLVRVISPEEFGQAAAVLGVLHFVNAFNCASPFAHGLQLPDGEEPDWSLHWRCGMRLQLGLALLTLALAAGAWSLSSYAPLGPLLACAALGELLDAPSRLRGVQLQRSLDFRRLRLANGVANLLGVACSLSLGWLGHGALGLVLAAHVVSALPLGVDLLLIAGWRPQPAPSGGLRSDWRAYRPALAFGVQQVAAGTLRGARGLLASLVLPPLLGFEAVGLLNRAEALFASTVQRFTAVLTETVYPLLPRASGHLRRFRRISRALLLGTAALVIPGAAFLSLCGPETSRLLYGARWTAADPLLTPLALAGACSALAGAAYRVLLARGRLLVCFRIDLATAGLGILPLIGVAWGAPLEVYAWALVGPAALVLGIAFLALIRDVARLRLLRLLAPIPLGAGSGAAAVFAWHQLRASDWSAGRGDVILEAGWFFVACLSLWRICFPHMLARLLRDLGLARLGPLLYLPAPKRPKPVGPNA